MIDLTIVWALIIAFAIAAYVVMDGFDLGIGILFPGFPVGRERDQAMNAIAPVWDGNETWLVLGGGGLLAAFPLAYAIILPALYAPLTAMLLALIFRGVAFEYRWRDPAHRRFWDSGFFLGSLVATFAQGVTLGALIQGIHVEGRAYAGGWWDWLTGFSLLTGASLAIGYALLGAGWLVWKTDGEVRRIARRRAHLLFPALLAAILLISAATVVGEPHYVERWLAWPALLVAAPMPLLVGACFWLGWRSLSGPRDRAPFLWSLTLFGLTLAGLGISIWPYVVPGRVTIWEAAAPHSSQAFMLVGSAVLIPMILAYTAWSYWVFRGKVGEGGYH
ncbi:MAG TPA: cytochrome d ubiquinol oxidase subunit II [Allosphingosinicella sp.]